MKDNHKKGDASTGRYKAISYQLHRKGLFRKLVVDDPESLAIIECAIEIESSGRRHKGHVTK